MKVIPWQRMTVLAILPAMFLLVSVESTVAQDDKPSSDKEQSAEKIDATDEEAPDVSDQLKKAKSEHRKMVRELAVRMRDAESDEERESIIKERRAAELEITKRVVKLTQENDDDSLDIKVLSWLTQYSKGGGRALAAETLMKDHIESEDLDIWVKSLGNAKYPNEEIENMFRGLIEKSPNDNVKALATFNLAMTYQELAGASDAKRDRWSRSLSEAEVAYLKKWDTETAQIECEKLLQECVDNKAFAKVEFGRNSRLGAQASSILARANLKVGKVAPDIVGKDLDDVEFKLSDYRGKVVLLDFWGDW